MFLTGNRNVGVFFRKLCFVKFTRKLFKAYFNLFEGYGGAF